MTPASNPATAVVNFGSAHEAERSIAGLSAVARITRELRDAGIATAWLATPPGQVIGDPARRDIARLANSMTVCFGDPGGLAGVARFPGNRLIPASVIAAHVAGSPAPLDRAIALDRPGAEMAILRLTAKPSDGVVSRWLNRPISRQLSAMLLRVPGITPFHATLGTALLAVAMFASLVMGTRSGLVVGALLFQAASIFDGVDGEIARATFRTTRKGATLDSAIDMATNVAAMLGLAINLARRGQPDALPLITWSLCFFLLGLLLIGSRSLRRSGTISFDGVKHEVRRWSRSPLTTRIMAFATLCTSRDFCAMVYLVLVLCGVPMFGLYLFAVVAPTWFLFVAKALWPQRARMAPAHVKQGGR